MTGAKRDATLDGLRGAAALAVVYYHYVFLTGLAERPGAGHIGVQVFFVLSGYLITRLLWRPGSGMTTARYWRFVKRRITRLYPALLGALGVGGLLIAWIGPETWQETLFAAVVAAAQLTSFFHAAGAIRFQTWGHTWSLTVEWVFYLLWPLVLLLLHRRGSSTEGVRRTAWWLAGGLFFASLLLPPDAFYLLPVANLAVMLVGAALALAHQQRTTGRFVGREPRSADLAFLLFLVLVFLPSHASGAWLFRVTMFPAAVLAAYFIIDQRPGTVSVVRRVLESRPMTTIGLMSYSLYLWHTPLLWLVWWGFPGLSPLARVGIALGALVPVVTASFQVLERPWLHIPKAYASALGQPPPTTAPAGST